MTNRKTVAIVGRPNVGKSALFNRLVGKRIAIVDSKPGITRDRIYADVSWDNRHFRLIDTGGIVVDITENIEKQVKIQADVAICEADRILFVGDVNDGLIPLDKEIFTIVRKAGKQVIVCVNKVDNKDKEAEIGDFFSLGENDIYPVSALHGLGINLLLDEISRGFPETKQKEEEIVKIAVVGKPNVGKSSLINYLLSEERSIVSEIPGTTRDSINTALIKNNHKYLLIDTAGIKASKKIKESVEYFSVNRSTKSIARCDVAVLMIDAEEGLTSQDLRIARLIKEKGKGAIIAVNKWDLIKGVMMQNYAQKLLQKMKFLSYAPVVFTSALSGRNVDKLPELSQVVYDQGKHTMDTSILNKFLKEAQAKYQPPLVSGKRLKIYYMTQIGNSPPAFVIFVNYKSLLKQSYEHYLINKLRKKFDFTGNPLVFKYKNRRKV